MSEFKSNVETKMASEKSFGIVFAVVFLLIGLYPLLKGGEIRWWSIIITLIFLLLAFFAPKTLTVFNKLWFKLGMLLGAIVSPIVMALIFYITVVPTGLIMKLLGKDLLRQKIDKDKKSYWIKREQPVGSMKNQF